jgi:phosphatidylserine decarboxylase
MHASISFEPINQASHNVNDALIVSLLSAVPKNRGARFMGAASRLRLPRFAHRMLLRWFVKKYKVDLSESVGTIEDFDSLAQFFIRTLKPGVRPIDDTPGILVSPVDARAHTFGLIEDGLFLQAPGRPCPIAALVGEEEAQRFEGGTYAVLYLAPPDYHRVHSPVACTVESMDYRAGTLWPVFAAATRKVEDLFARNERLVFSLNSDAGRISYVMVGAFGVGRIGNVFDDTVTNTGSDSSLRTLDPAPAVERGEELGRTVILLCEPGRVEWEMEPGQVLRLGRRIATVHPAT